MRSIAVFLIVWIGGAGWVFMNYGWEASLFWASSMFLSFTAGWLALQWDIQTDGYLLAKNKDKTGRSRWRVGVRPPPVRAPESEVQWIVPPSK